MKRMIGFFVFITLLLTGCSMNYLYSNDKKISSYTNSFNLNKAEQTIEDQEYIGELEFEGMDTVWIYNAEQDMDIEVSYLLSVSEGKAKLVFIGPEGELKILVENTGNVIQKEMKTSKFSLKKGKNRIKLIGANKAQIYLKLKINEGILYTVGF